MLNNFWKESWLFKYIFWMTFITNLKIFSHFFQLMHIFLVTDHVTVQMTLLTTVRKSTRLAYFLTKAKKHRMWLCNSDCFPIKFQGWLQEWLPSSFASWETLSFLSSFFLTEGKLLYNVVFISAIQQHESAVSTHISPPSRASLPPPQPIPLGHHRALS